jgi:hypothetical protein
MLKKRNAAGLAMNIIIIAILGLIVLGIMVAIFSTESGDAVNTLKTCAAKGGVCEDSCDGRTIGDKNELGCTGNTVCCIDI